MQFKCGFILLCSFENQRREFTIFFLFFYNTFDAVTHLLHTVSLKCGNSLSTQVKTNLMFAFTIQDFVEPIYFYVGTVFGLQAVCVTALFVCSWVMSGTWVAGMLAVSWYVINRWEHTTLLLNCVKTVVLNWQIKVCFENLILPFFFKKNLVYLFSFHLPNSLNTTFNITYWSIVNSICGFNFSEKIVVFLNWLCLLKFYVVLFFFLIDKNLSTLFLQCPPQTWHN